MGRSEERGDSKEEVDNRETEERGRKRGGVIVTCLLAAAN